MSEHTLSQTMIDRLQAMRAKFPPAQLRQFLVVGNAEYLRQVIETLAPHGFEFALEHDGSMSRCTVLNVELTLVRFDDVENGATVELPQSGKP